MNHWVWSCRINAILMGSPREPLCSRVYRQPDCLLRRAFLRTADRAFDEEDHCLRIHVRWLIGI